LIDEKIYKILPFLKSRLFKNSFYTGLALIFIGLIPFTFNFLVGRTFGAATLGKINIIINFCLIITIFISNFFGSAGNKFLAEFRGSKNLDNFIYTFKIIFFGSSAILVLTGIILFFGWGYFSIKFSIPDNLLYLIILYIFFRTIYVLLRRTLYGMDLVKQYAQNEIFSAIIMFIMIFYVSFYQLPNLLIHTYLISYLFFLILGINTLLKNFNHIKATMDKTNSFSKKNVLKNFSKYGLVSMIGTVASTGTGYISVIVTGIFSNHSDAGIYTAVLSIVSVLLFFPKLFIQVFLPEFSKLFGQGEKAKIVQIFKKTFSMLFLFSLIMCLLLFLFGEAILNLFGEDFASGKTILVIIIPSIFIKMISIPCNAFLSGTKYILIPNIGGIIIFVVSLVSWLLFIPKYNETGIAMGYSLGIIIGIGYQILSAFFKLRSFIVNN
tara:strand:+ start:902 stop:2215 length:1314 start_codon:yes stop_codon:yes gene_type:complete